MAQPSSQIVYYDTEADYQGGFYDEYLESPEYENPFEVGLPAPQNVDEFTGEEDEHLRAENVWGTLKKTFVMTIEGSLAEFARDPSKATWKLPPDAQQFLKRVASQRNRTNAKKEDRSGDLTRGISLKTHIVGLRNEFPVDMGVDIPGLVPENLTSVGRHNFVLQANTPPKEGIAIDISAPDNVFSEWMYENWREATPEDLDKEIIMPDPKAETVDKDYAHVRVNGMIWPTIVTFVKRGIFPGYEDQILHAEQQMQGNNMMQLMTVPVEMVSKVRDYLAEPLKEIDRAFMDMTKVQGRFVRMDGQPWDSHSSLVGEAVSVGDDEGEFAAHQISKPCKALVKVQMEYILHSKN